MAVNNREAAVVLLALREEIVGRDQLFPSTRFEPTSIAMEEVLFEVEVLSRALRIGESADVAIGALVSLIARAARTAA